MLTRAFRWVDQYYIQYVSTPAQAAVATSIFVMVVFHALTEVVSVGTAPFVARATGAQDPEDRARRVGNGLLSGALLGAGVGLAGWFGAEHVGAWVGVSGQTAVLLGRYLQVLSLGAVFLAWGPLVDQSFIALGRARVPALLHAVSFGLNVALTHNLIFTWGLGIEGAAWGSVFGRTVASLWGVGALAHHVGLRPRHLRVRPGPMVRVGGPAALATGLFGLVYWGLLRFAVAPLGPAATAALGIGFTALEGVTWPLYHGLGLGLASEVGRGLGRRRPDLGWSCIRRFLPLSLGLGVAAWAIFLGLGDPWTGLFASDPDVHRQARLYAHTLAWSQPFLALESLMEGVIFGSGHTVWMLRISVPMNLLRIPLAVWLAHHLGWEAFGVWWAINLSTMAKSILHTAVVAKGSWTRPI